MLAKMVYEYMTMWAVILISLEQLMPPTSNNLLHCQMQNITKSKCL